MAAALQDLIDEVDDTSFDRIDHGGRGHGDPRHFGHGAPALPPSPRWSKASRIW